jgi:hypothetical protein
MKKVVIIFMLALGFAWNCHAQSWTYVQDSLATFCVGPASSCDLTTGNILPTTAGTVWVVAVQTTNNVIISSVTGGGGTWTLCPASSCHLFNSTLGRNVDMAYNLSGNAGTSSIRVNLSGNSGTILGVNFFELLPPFGSTASFDAAGTTSSTSCSGTCTGVALSITGTDAIIQSLHANSTNRWNAWSSPYTTLPLGEGLLLNATNGAAPTATVSGTGAVTNAIAFKSTAGSYSPPPQPMSVVNYTVNTLGINCSPNCSIPIPSTGSGHLLYMEMANITGNFISSVSGGGTWAVPTGANSCRISMVLSGNDALSCAYVLSSTSGVTSLNVTMNGNANNTYFAIWEIASTSGAFSFDTQGSATNSASPNPSGVTLSLTGANDVIFQSIFVPGGSSSVGFYPMPRIPGQATQFYNNQAASAVLLNTRDGAAPLWIDQQNQATVVTGVAFKTGPSGTAVAPPTGLAAVVN